MNQIHSYNEKKAKYYKLYHIKNRAKKILATKIWRIKNPEKRKTWCLKWYYKNKKRLKLNILLSSIKSRCKNLENYHGKGIKNFLSLDDLRLLWIRDNADSMKIPSIDRIDNDGHYILKNCRFIEFYKNKKKGELEKMLNKNESNLIVGKINKTGLSDYRIGLMTAIAKSTIRRWRTGGSNVSKAKFKILQEKGII